jgi:RimJ/RimL family protein N-acetyltransferase
MALDDEGGSSVAPDLADGVVILTRYTEDDVPAHLAGEDEETARRFGWWPRTSTEATVHDAFAGWARNWETSGPIRAFALREQATGRLLGGCELRIMPDDSAHVAYWTSAGERGHGHATRGLILLLRYAHSLGFDEVEAHIAPDNQASCRVAEKAGFRRSGPFTAADGATMIRYHAVPAGAHWVRAHRS